MPPPRARNQSQKRQPAKPREPASGERQPPAQPPNPTRRQSPNGAAEEGSSPTSPPVSSGADGLLLADPGPAFDPKAAPEAPAVELQAEKPGLLEEWDEARVREALELQGETLHAFFNGGPEDHETWIHTEKDLRAIAPPFTRILNRYDATRAAAAAGDEILLAAAVARYGTRNYIKRRKYIAVARANEAEEPRSGAQAPEGTGPEHDADWQRTHPDQPDPMGAPPDLIPRGARR